MKVKCIANTGKHLSKKTLEVYAGLSTSKYDLKIGEVYTVYGIILWKGTLAYLTFGDSPTVPIYNPADLFEVVDHRLPPDWYFSFMGYGETLNDAHWRNAIWGYEELVLNEAHSQKLIEGETDTMKIFLRRKYDVDHYFNDNCSQT